MLSGTTWHNLAQPGTTATRKCSHNRRRVAHLGTTWHNVAQPGTTGGCVFESCRAYHL